MGNRMRFSYFYGQVIVEKNFHWKICFKILSFLINEGRENVWSVYSFLISGCCFDLFRCEIQIKFRCSVASNNKMSIVARKITLVVSLPDVAYDTLDTIWGSMIRYDDVIIKGAIRKKCRILEEYFPWGYSVFQEVEMCVTKCVLHELEQLGSALYGALHICKQFTVRDFQHFVTFYYNLQLKA